MHIYVFYAVRAFYSIFIIFTIVQKNGDGHIQELWIYTVLEYVMTFYCLHPEKTFLSYEK
ncbi:hypothetical protein AI2601V1_5294 (plasmid) [Klebsiella pneumoniae]|uniref:Uncharacterized protein n=1 Tax=Klebsiella pneumoniae TaxID=573 RepID=A0A6M6A0L8_KLEPN|nr:hypothetical protein [Klebsiella pneumoniae]UOL51894.1 hypothetical protein NDJJOOAI_00368 [Escherichia coli]VUT09329.1 hypothetical protein SB6413_05640 [Klebsiella pasteurii]QJX12148.1 hypothetical protein [Klebsiella pneumoniae]CAE6081558.1 hypothetical protein AI2591V1_5290 [Klebsiella pneumoniae]